MSAIDETLEPEQTPEAESLSPEAQLEEKNKQCDELVDRLQRTLAEFDNFRKRTAKEKASMYDMGLRDTVEKLLPILDNFERALSTGSGQTDRESSFYKGLEMIFRQFKDLLTDLGVEVIPAVGQSFDHNLHFAVSHVEDENYGENEIIEEMQKGYQCKDKVIRTSMVKVAN